MKTAREVAKKLRQFLNDNQYTLSDLRRAQISLLNGTLMEGTARPRKIVKEATEAEECQA
jgi:hypothetical protein